MKRCSSVSRLSSCSLKRVLAGRVREGSERSCTVGRRWPRTRNQEVQGENKKPQDQRCQLGSNSGARAVPGGGGRVNGQRFLRTQILLGAAGRARVLRSLYFVNKH